MVLIVWYLVFMVAGDILAFLLGTLVERQFGSNTSLIVFLVLYFVFLWVSWMLAVRVTKPAGGEIKSVTA